MFRLLVIFCCVTFVAARVLAVEPSTANRDVLHGEVTRLLDELDSDRFEVRRKAAERLEELVDKPELGRFLAAEFHRVLRRPDASFEVRWHLTRWSRRLPQPPPEPVGDVSPQELDRLVRQLDDDSYAVRLGAAEQIDWLLNNPQLVCPMLIRLKRRLADPSLAAETRKQLEAAWQRARGAWLLTDPASWRLPAVSDQQIGQWLDDLARPAPPGETANTGQAWSTANRELLDLLARDEYVTRLAAAIQARLDRNPDAATAARLKELLDWTKPAMVAEFWRGRHQVSEQHLLVGVPTLSPGGLRPTHFDRCDDRLANYVAGNSLTPGSDYPVGVAFPHPQREDGFFDLVNLPTPRRRMAYAYYVRTDESKRLALLSRRTLDQVLAEKRLMTEPELLILGQLDPAEVSRFAGKYFLLVDDGQLAASGRQRLGGRPSRFGMICVQLALDGVNGALPGLTDAIAKDVFWPPTARAPYWLQWVAALSIAARDPWPEVDSWLAGRVSESETLIEGGQSAPELGATAAALLLGRHGRTAAQFGLQSAADPLLAKLHVEGYRFGSDETRQKVRQWWDAEKDKKKTP